MPALPLQRPQGAPMRRRCTPASVVSTLEAVNMVLGGGKFLVVVGAPAYYLPPPRRGMGLR